MFLVMIPILAKMYTAWFLLIIPIHVANYFVKAEKLLQGSLEKRHGVKIIEII